MKTKPRQNPKHHMLPRFTRLKNQIFYIQSVILTLFILNSPVKHRSNLEALINFVCFNIVISGIIEKI